MEHWNASLLECNLVSKKRFSQEGIDVGVGDADGDEVGDGDGGGAREVDDLVVAGAAAELPALLAPPFDQDLYGVADDRLKPPGLDVELGVEEALVALAGHRLGNRVHALGGLNKPDQHGKGSGLARTVGASQAYDPVRYKVQVHATDDGPPAAGLHQPLGHQIMAQPVHQIAAFHLGGAREFTPRKLREYTPRSVDRAKKGKPWGIAAMAG